MKKILKNIKEHGSRYFFGLYPLGGSLLFIYITINQNRGDTLSGILASVFLLILAIIFFSPNKRYNYILASFLLILLGISIGMEGLKTCTNEDCYGELIPGSILGLLVIGFLIGKYYGIGLVDYYIFCKKVLLSNFFLGLLKIIGYFIVIGIIGLLIYGLAGTIAGLSSTTIIIILLVLILMKK